MESCGMSTIKYILFFFNFIFAISGLGIIIAGAVVLSDVNEFKHFLEGRILAPPIVLIIAGTIVFIIAFLGCYGAIKEHYNLLIVFAVALLVIFIIELAVGIAAAVFKNDFDGAMRQALQDSMSRYSDTSSESDKMAWDKVQMKFECCGIDNPSDWQTADPSKFSRGLPPSCCKTYTASPCSASPYESFSKGCFTELQMKVQKNAKILIGVGIGIAFVEVAGIILACFLAYAIKRENEGK
ncbi:CD151 antigen [Nasonia vitripennis]|uniref:Tetraspanin n=1 Tax=Nasonia vitripennis TaxID=7425 RepID=A0A7M7G3B6_NASVI|nr:CD151 antigen [Nasonia vitripennis]